ncbi:MAG: hypothetical protein NT029_18945 [Armatimonadetes bacterium]|nr:hypothetical protein [Armatimonadota bacterium]
MAPALVWLAVASTALAAAPSPQIRYTVTPQPPDAGRTGRTKVEVSIAGLTTGRPVRLVMPSWTPGDYRLQNHWRGVTDFAAAMPDGTPLAVSRPERDLWEVAARGAELRVRYMVSNQEAGLFSENALVTDRYAYLSGPAVLMLVQGRQAEPVTLTVEAPQGWPPAICPLPEQVGEAGGFAAPSYDALADAPILVGRRDESTFLEAGIRVTVATFGPGAPADAGPLAARFRPAVASAVAMFGSAPFKRYTLFVDGGNKGGGLEHADSARVAWSGAPNSMFTALACHEFLHAWNVKRLRPQGMIPYDYRSPLRCRSLWFAEGVTEYLARLALFRSGQITQVELLNWLADDIAQYESTPAAANISAEEASRRVWEGGQSSGYAGLSYYMKGELIGFCLDAAARRGSQGVRGLEDVVRRMLPLYSPPKPGYAPPELRESVLAVAGPEVGSDYDALVAGVGPMPFEWAAEALGLRLERTRSGLSLTVDPAASAEMRARRDAWLWGREALADPHPAETAPAGKDHALLPVNLGATWQSTSAIGPPRPRRPRPRRVASVAGRFCLAPC